MPDVWGKDRFRVQPNRPDGGKWYCRGCGEGKWHDAIDYIARRDNLDFQAALSALAGNQPTRQMRETPTKPEIEEPSIDRKKWVDTARRFVNMCAEKLWDGSSIKALDYLRGRGLLDDTLLAWQIGYHADEANGNPVTWGMSESDLIYLPRGIVIPCFSETTLHYVKIRKSAGPKKYRYIEGSQPFLYGAQTYRASSIAFLFESELDVLLAWQTDYKVGYASIPAGQPLRPEYAPYFVGVDDLIIAFDNDDPGNAAAGQLCRISPKFHKASPVPAGKDLTEYYQSTGYREDVFYYLYDAVGCIGAEHGS